MSTLDPYAIRLLSRLTDRMDLIRKNPHRYRIEPRDRDEIVQIAEQLELLLTRIQTIKAG